MYGTIDTHTPSSSRSAASAKRRNGCESMACFSRSFPSRKNATAASPSMTRGDWLTRGPSICGSSECYARPRRVLPSAASRTRCATTSSRTAARCELKLPAPREASREAPSSLARNWAGEAEANGLPAGSPLLALWVAIASLAGAAPRHPAPATSATSRAAAPHSFRSRRGCTRGRPGTGRRTHGSLLPSQTRADRNQGNLLSTCEGKAADNPVKTMLCKKVILCTKGKPDTAGDPAINCCLSFLLFTTTSQDKQTQKKPICTGL